jgi:hypothetical protein
MELEWVKLHNSFDSEEKALKAATVVATTESRLSSQARGPQYEVETRIEQVADKWLVFWRKVFVGNKTGCGGGCGSCHNELPEKNNDGQKNGKVLPFRKPTSR